MCWRWGRPRWCAARRWGRRIARRAAGLLARGDDAIDLLRSAAGVLGDCGARVEHTRALGDLGAAVRRAGHPAQARPVLRDALAFAEDVGAGAVAQAARTELRVAGGRASSRARTPAERLTPVSDGSPSSPPRGAATGRSPTRCSSRSRPWSGTSATPTGSSTCAADPTCPWPWGLLGSDPSGRVRCGRDPGRQPPDRSAAPFPGRGCVGSRCSAARDGRGARGERGGHDHGGRGHRTVGREVVRRLGEVGALPLALVRAGRSGPVFGGRIAVRADLDRPETVDAALDGVDRLFLLTRQTSRQLA
jgi:hypothetical protein